jgi:hypothetical protein
MKSSHKINLEILNLEILFILMINVYYRHVPLFFANNIEESHAIQYALK